MDNELTKVGRSVGAGGDVRSYLSVIKPAIICAHPQDKRHIHLILVVAKITLIYGHKAIHFIWTNLPFFFLLLFIKILCATTIAITTRGVDFVQAIELSCTQIMSHTH